MTSFVESHCIKKCSVYVKETWIYFSQRLTAVQINKGVQHFLERNIDLFSRRATAVQTSVREVKESMEGTQNYDTIESFT